MVELSQGTSSTSNSGPMDRVAETLKSAFDRQDYYEAHQIYKSLYFR